MSDADLLRCYLQDESADAFAAIVQRHLDLVYSVARRKTGSSSLAEDVAQSVFIELARHAHRIKPGTPLVAWLHVVARRTAINTVRDDARRHAREQSAAEVACGELIESVMKSSNSNWQAVEPLLDDAVESLAEPDRAAILLRYFENKSLREVGAALGTSDDAAQKRVARAVDHLRAFFLRRGVAATAAGLATDLSAHALQVAPAGLGATISSAALSGAAAATALGPTKIFLMTTPAKTLLATLCLVAIGGGIYQATLHARRQADLAALQSDSASLARQLQQTRTELTAATADLRSVETEIDTRLAHATAAQPLRDDALDTQTTTWLARLTRMKQLLAERPNQRIPEMQLLADDAWLRTASLAYLDSEYGVREALASLRQQAEGLMARKIVLAMQAYSAAHKGVLADSVAQLLPFLDPAIDPTWMDRYQFGHIEPGTIASTPGGNTLTLKTLIDRDYDTYWSIGPGGLNTFVSATGVASVHGDAGISLSSISAMDYNLAVARSGFAAANGGGHATTASQLIPYLKWPIELDALKLYLHPPYQPRR
jgi:RNA polymerase sigma factor (sigma-70 family)